MKILVVGTGGALAASGITTAANQTAALLADMGHEVDRLAAGTRRRRRPNRLNFENVLAVVGDAISTARRARAFDADVVWLHTFGVPTLPALRTLLMALAVRAQRRRIVVHFHAFGLEDYVATAGNALRITLRLLAFVSAQFVAVHDAAGEALERWAAGKVTVLHNWVEVPPDPTPIPPGPPWRMVFVGALVNRKGIYELVDAMRLLADVPVSLVLVGGAGDEGPAEVTRLEAAAGDLVEAGKVAFAGERDAAGVRDELRASHLFVLPSKAEGMPLAMLEAMAQGRAVVVSDAGNMREVVNDVRCGIVVDRVEPSSIAGAVRDMAVDPRWLAEAGTRAHRAAVERFSPSASAAVVERVLNLLDST